MTGSGLFFSIVAGLILALLTARPGRRIGPRDERLSDRDRWAYFTFTLAMGTIGYVILTIFLEDASVLALVLALIPFTIVLIVLQLLYYVFLVSEEPEDNRS